MAGAGAYRAKAVVPQETERERSGDTVCGAVQLAPKLAGFRIGLLSSESVLAVRPCCGDGVEQSFEECDGLSKIEALMVTGPSDISPT